MLVVAHGYARAVALILQTVCTVLHCSRYNLLQCKGAEKLNKILFRKSPSIMSTSTKKFSLVPTAVFDDLQRWQRDMAHSTRQSQHPSVSLNGIHTVQGRWHGGARPCGRLTCYELSLTRTESCPRLYSVCPRHGGHEEPVCWHRGEQTCMRTRGSSNRSRSPQRGILVSTVCWCSH